MAVSTRTPLKTSAARSLADASGVTTRLDFAGWREAARGFLQQRVPPSEAHFTGAQTSLFAPSLFAPSPSSSSSAAPQSINVPRAFLDLARLVTCHTDPSRLDLLYRLLWRLQEQRGLLDDLADVDVSQARRLEKNVHRDIHKLHAFVRFREIKAAPNSANNSNDSNDSNDSSSLDVDHFVAFHRPDFFVVQEATPFFARRFPQMRWSIMTPKGSAFFVDGVLSFGDAVHVDGFDGVDDAEALWRTYYAAIYNPARANPTAMRSEMPQKHWRTLPEASLIPALLQEAARRTSAYVDASGPDKAGARPFIPRGRPALAQLREAAVGCTGCALALTTSTSCPTQVVFGEGPATARVMIVGEQPGDEEDRVGRPFVGPAGRLLDELLVQAGIDRAQLYLTNTVKHFRHQLTETAAVGGTRERTKKHRLHERPTAADVKACRPWLDSEVAAIAPAAILCLGQTAARAVVDPRFEVGTGRGVVLTTSYAPRTVVTWHPAAILRAAPELQQQMRAQLLADLRLAVFEDGSSAGASP